MVQRMPIVQPYPPVIRSKPALKPRKHQPRTAFTGRMTNQPTRPPKRAPGKEGGQQVNRRSQPSGRERDRPGTTAPARRSTGRPARRRSTTEALPAWRFLPSRAAAAW